MNEASGGAMGAAHEKAALCMTMLRCDMVRRCPRQHESEASVNGTEPMSPSSAQG